MMLRNCLKSAVGLVALVAAGPVWAADSLPPPAPSFEAGDGTSSCLYTRLDVGISLPERPTILPGGGRFEDGALAEVGIGCQLLDTFRVEWVFGARLPQDLGGAVDGDIQSSSGFVNFTYDITNYAGWTPYIGAGAGAAFHRLVDIVTPVTASDGEDLDFAWNFHMGVSYDLTPGSKIDFGYRLSDLGKVTSGGPSSFTVDDIMAHEFKVGYRFHFGTW